MGESIITKRFGYRGLWSPNTPYLEGESVFYNGSLWVANTSFISDGLFNEVNWTCPQCESGVGALGWDPANSAATHNFTDDNRTATSTINTSSASAILYSINTYNTSSVDGVYFEYTLGYSNNSNQVGMAYKNPYVGWTGDRLVYRNTKRFYFLSTDVPDQDQIFGTWPNLFDPNDRLRYFIKGQSVWVGYYDDSTGTSFVDGDPVAGTGAFITQLPANEDVYLFAFIVNKGDFLTAHTQAADLSAPTLGFTPWDEQ